MSERLEEIKKYYTEMHESHFESEVYLGSGDVYWLIEQAEQVHLMRKLVNYHQQKKKEAEDENEPYRHQNRRYRIYLEKAKIELTVLSLPMELKIRNTLDVLNKALTKEE